MLPKVGSPHGWRLQVELGSTLVIAAPASRGSGPSRVRGLCFARQLCDKPRAGSKQHLSSRKGTLGILVLTLESLHAMPTTPKEASRRFHDTRDVANATIIPQRKGSHPSIYISYRWQGWCRTAYPSGPSVRSTRQQAPPDPRVVAVHEGAHCGAPL